MDCPQQQLIELPSRERCQSIIRDYMLPRVRVLVARVERTARRPLHYDVEGDLEFFVQWAETAPQPILYSLTHLYLWAWMRLDKRFRLWMFGGAEDTRFWVVAKGLLRCWQTAREVEWPANPLSGKEQQVIRIWMHDETILFGLAVDWYILTH